MDENVLRCLTVRQPFAQLICTGIKNIENRSWKLPESIRGERVFVHASAKLDERHRDMSQLFTPAQWESLDDNMQKRMIGGILPVSAIIGSVRFVDCVQDSKSVWAIDGQYHWVIEDPILYVEPILNVKGKLNFWKL